MLHVRLPWIGVLLGCTLWGCVQLSQVAASELNGKLPEQVSQGQLVLAQVAPGSRVSLDGRVLRVSERGWFAFGVERDASRDLVLDVVDTDASRRRITLPVRARDWPIERVNGVPEKTVNPPPEIAARIAREQAAVAVARERDDARADFSEGFVWPLAGRISGRFGRQRIYNGSPNAPHSGTDIAAPSGTAVLAPAAGIVTLAEASLYLTGGTVLLDHGAGVSSAFLHLSRVDVQPGQRLEQGERLGAVGATGRATGPHLHWGLNWFNVRLDPELIAPPMQ